MQDEKHVILCVDDDEDILMFLSTVLESAGYAVMTADSCQDGISVYDPGKVDIVIADLMMETIDAGINFVTHVRKTSPDIPVYMLSSVGDSLSETTDTSQLGLTGVFQKPIDREKLLSVIKSKLA